MKTPPKEITVCHLEVVVMPNGEVLCAGKTVGWVTGKNGIGKYLTVEPPGAVGHAIHLLRWWAEDAGDQPDVVEMIKQSKECAGELEKWKGRR